MTAPDALGVRFEPQRASRAGDFSAPFPFWMLPMLLVLACTGPAPADLVLTHGAIYTEDATRSWAEAVAVRGGRIVYLGTAQGAQPYIGRGTRVLDLRGRMVLPGFQDGHVHALGSGVELTECVLFDAETPAAVADSIRRYAAAHPDAKWIRGSGWQLPVFRDANPTAAFLDLLVPDRPAILLAADGHSAWVNSRALRLAGISRDTPDPPNGRIERDRRTGAPTGTLRESAADLVAKLLPDYTPTEYEEGLRRALALANRYGITALYEANADEPKLAAYAALDRKGELTARVTVAMQTDPAKGEEQIARLEEWKRKYSTPRVHPIAAKIFADGVIEAGTAALLVPYLGQGSDRGTTNLEPEAMDRLVAALDRAGFQVHVHAIGDRAIRMTLDAFEHARAVNGVRDSRHLIAHLELIDPADIRRFRELGVVADFQPLWAFPDEYITELTIPKLGPARSRWLYPIGSVLATGAVVIGGSDWSVSSLNPLDAIQTGVTRRDLEDPPGPAWIPEEVASLPDMLAAYTINGAWATFQDRETGSIEVGKAADLIVLDRNLFALQREGIHSARVVLTLLEGVEVFRDPAAP